MDRNNITSEKLREANSLSLFPEPNPFAFSEPDILSPIAFPELNPISPIRYRRPTEQTIRPSQVMRSAWDLYNDKASEFDAELLKKWEGGLSIQLVFVSFCLDVYFRTGVLTI
jgi:hypothetical protein